MPEDWLGDTDEDELFDIYEKVIDTDPLNSDTDGDRLPDGYEVITLNTDPLEVDTDENGISDADEDFDNDNLNNLGEYQNKTEPYNPDTDDDGFLDSDEIKKYKTDPLNPDTDNDGLLDGEESYDGSIYAKYGIYFDPLNPDTNGNGILDGDEIFGQSKQQEVSTHDEAITEIKVDMDTNGNLDRNLTIESMYNVDTMSTNVYSLIGEPFNFETSTSFKSATITFKVDKSKLEDTKFDKLLILWYDEENQIFKEMETIHDEANSTVSTTTTHFSQYMIVDSDKWVANWEASFNELRKMWKGGTTTYKVMNTIFVIDCCSDMGRHDPNNQRLNICSNIVNGMMSEDRAAVITFSEFGTRGKTGLTDKNSALAILRAYINDSGAKSNLIPAFEDALHIANSSAADMNRIIILTNGNSTFTYNLNNYNLSNVTVNVVDMGGYTIGSSLMNIASVTGGSVYSIASARDLAYQSGEAIYIPPHFNGKDSDGDGIPDLVEEYGLKPNGQPINSNKYSKHSDDDGLEDNEELHFSKEKMCYDMNKSQYDGSVFVWSDPCLNDTDGDGLDDKEEREAGTNPRLVDTDGDGIDDFYDSNPTIPYTTQTIWQSSDEDYSTVVQIELLKLHLAWRLAKIDTEKIEIENSANDLRDKVSSGIYAILDTVKTITGAAADEFSLFGGGDAGRAERDYWLYEVNKFNPEIKIEEEKTFHAIMFIAGFISPSPDDAWKLISKKASKEMIEQVGETGAKKFLKSISKYAGAKGANGIKKIKRCRH